MSSKIMLDQLRIASPCRASWGEMTGDDGVRFCRICEQNVYNISALTADQAESLMRETEGNVCLRLYRRRDGTVMTSDCPPGAARAAWSRRRMLIAGAFIMLAGVLGAATSLRAAMAGRRSGFTLPPTGRRLGFQGWYDWALEVLGVRPRPVLMGRPCGPPAPPTPPSPTQTR